MENITVTTKEMTPEELAQALTKVGTRGELLIMGFVEGVKASRAAMKQKGA